jgi:hypothetical protein
MAVTIESIKARLYFAGSTYPIKDRLRSLGAHWDGDRKQWWIGAAKRADAEALVASLSAPVMTATAASARLAGSVGLTADAPAGVVADKLRDAGRDAEADAAAKPAEDVSGCRVYAAVTYRGRRMYVIAEQRDPQTHQPVRCRLTTLDGAAPVWADCSACELVRTYQGREKWDGRRYSGKTVTVYPTVESLREFRADRRRGERAGTPQCAACGKRSEGLVRDMEDGLPKCRACCDMPAD